MKMGRFDESIAMYRKALATDPNFAPSHIGVASNLMLQGKHDAARAETGSCTRRPGTTASGGARCSPPR